MLHCSAKKWDSRDALHISYYKLNDDTLTQYCSNGNKKYKKFNMEKKKLCNALLTNVSLDQWKLSHYHSHQVL